MKLIPYSQIVIKDNRQRQEFDPEALQELVNSIEDRGLMHAPVVREESNIRGGDLCIDTVLVAGERRLKALQQIWELGGTFKYNGQPVPEGFVPTVTLGELSELEAEEAELDENLKRKDLTWQEHAAALAKLHNLRQKQADVITKGRGVEEGPKIHTVADTARELHGRADGDFQDKVRRELIVARNLDNPAIAKAKTVDEAFKILKREDEAKRNVALATEVGKTFSAASHTCLNVNCLDWMRDALPEQFDCILTDPPYGMGADSFGDGAGKLAGIEHHYDDSPEAWRALLAPWSQLAYRVAKRQAHAYVFCDFDRFHELKSFMESAGWYVFRTPIIVYKTNSGRVPLPDRGPRRQYELVLYGIKGEKPVTHIYPDVIPSTADENMSHGAQKPVAVYQNLLQRTVKPGDRVLDSFGGSGTLLPAAHTMQCYATVLEQNPEYFGMILKRAQALDAQAQELIPGLG